MAICICSVCRQSFESGSSPALPFCSERCRLIDLRRWYGEEYSLPVERDQELETFKDPQREGED